MTAPISTTFESADFRKAMGTFATGVTVVTTTKGEEVVGMTANSFTSVSLSPALVLVSVGKGSAMHGFLQESRRFGITVLKSEHEHLSNYFAGKRTPEVEAQLAYDWHEDIPMLATGMANLACRTWAEYDGGDHTLFVGEVIGLRVLDPNDPLLYYQGYRRLGS